MDIDLETHASCELDDYGELTKSRSVYITSIGSVDLYFGDLKSRTVQTNDRLQRKERSYQCA